MTWVQRYRLRHYVANSIWIAPLIGILAAMVSVRLLHRMEKDIGWTLEMDIETARAVLGTMASSMFTFIVFVCSALLVAVQLASGQLTPRIIAIVFRDPLTKYSLTVFAFTFTFSLAVLTRIGPDVPSVTAHMAAYLCVASMGLFLYLIDHVGRTLRPSGVLRAVATIGRAVIDDVYPQRLHQDGNEQSALADGWEHGPVTTIPSPTDGVVLAVDMRGLSALARRAHCVIEIVPQVGDFVAADDPLFRIHGGGEKPNHAELTGSIALGQERTMTQDPTFIFRIMVDIASKALSPAINDPTTAVLALDQIHRLLRVVGHRDLENGIVKDDTGQVRLVYRTPDWDDFVLLAVTEILHFGGESIQVTRRLGAMLENLIQTLPEIRAPLLRRELSLLHRVAMRFPEPEDRALAVISDLQGVGGRRGARGQPQNPATDSGSAALSTATSSTIEGP